MDQCGSAWQGLAALFLLGRGLFCEAPVKKRLAVVPFQLERTEGSTIVRCRGCGNVMTRGRSKGTLGKTDPHGLGTAGGKAEDFELISPGQVEGVYQPLLAKKIDSRPRASDARLSGQALKADADLWGEVFRYEDRRGTGYAVNRPASVSLDLHLMRVGDGALSLESPMVGDPEVLQ